VVDVGVVVVLMESIHRCVRIACKWREQGPVL
jgi:hypothetical protein